MTVTAQSNVVRPTLLAEQLKDRLDIVEVARELHGTLRGSNQLYQGSHSPVHESSGGQCLTIYPATKSWYCFHCGNGGDVLDLIGVARFGEVYNPSTNFQAVLEEASRMSGLINSTISHSNFNTAWSPTGDQATRLYALLTHSAEWFHKQLTQTPEILEFLKKNYGFSEEFIAEKKIGFAPLQTGNEENRLLDYLKKLGYTLTEAQAASIVNKGGYCRYQGRIMFPYWKNNLVVYFAARATTLTPKNEFETNPNSEFKKYRKLKIKDAANPQIGDAIRNDIPFGLDNLRLARKKGYLLITEGIPDQLAAEQAGLPCLSPATTHFKPAQLLELVEYCQGLQVYLCFDNELSGAGEEAALEAARFLEQKGLKSYLIKLPRPAGINKIDLCEYLRDSGIASFNSLMESALRLPDYLITHQPVPEKAEAKAEYISQIAELALKHCRYDKISLNNLQQKLATSIEVRLGVIREMFKDTNSAPSTESGQEESNNNEKKSDATRLVEMAGNIELFHTQELRAYATVKVEEHFETWPLRSRWLKLLLKKRFYQKFKAVPRTQTLEDALGILEAQALEGSELPVYGRLAFYEGCIYLDLTNESWEVVKISPEGWEILAHSPVKFRRTNGVLPLPRPGKGGKLIDLQRFININPKDWKLLAGWLVTAFNPDCQYPVLTISGEQGSAKSTVSRFIRKLIDPSVTMLRATPRDERDFWISSQSSWVMAYDNLSGIPPWLSDTICRVATGGGNATRQLYSDDEEVFFDAKRPVLLNGIDSIATRGDLLERSLIITLPAIPEENRKPEKQLFREFEEALPFILGGLLNAVSTALARLDQIKLERLPRMADFTLWAVAAEPAFGGSTEITFLQAYREQREDSHAIALEASQLGQHLLRWFEDYESKAEEPQKGWLNNATELLYEIEAFMPEEERRVITRQFGWPKNGRALSVQLHRLAPNLRAAGLLLAFDVYAGTIKRGISITRYNSTNRAVPTQERVQAYAQGLTQNSSRNSGTQTVQTPPPIEVKSTQPVGNSTQTYPASTQTLVQPEICVTAENPNFEFKMVENSENGTQNTQNLLTFQSQKKENNLQKTPDAYFDRENKSGGICVPSVPAYQKQTGYVGAINDRDSLVAAESSSVEKPVGQFQQFLEQLEDFAEDYQELLNLKGAIDNSHLAPQPKSWLLQEIRSRINRIIE